MVDSLILCATIWASWGVSSLNVCKVLVEGYVSHSELDKNTGMLSREGVY